MNAWTVAALAVVAMASAGGQANAGPLRAQEGAPSANAAGEALHQFVLDPRVLDRRIQRFGAEGALCDGEGTIVNLLFLEASDFDEAASLSTQQNPLFLDLGTDLLGRHPPAHLVFGGAVLKVAQLFVHLAVFVVPSPQGAKSGEDASSEPHLNSYETVCRIRAMAAACRFQSFVSLNSLRAPAFVKE